MFLFEGKTGLLSTCELCNGYKSDYNPVWVMIIRVINKIE